MAALKRTSMALILTQVSAGVGTALPPYKHRRGFFARGGGFAIGNTGPSEEIEALAGESFDWLANLGAPAALVQQTLHLAARREHAADAVAGLGRGAD